MSPLHPPSIVHHLKHTIPLELTAHFHCSEGAEWVFIHCSVTKMIGTSGYQEVTCKLIFWRQFVFHIFIIILLHLLTGWIGRLLTRVRSVRSLFASPWLFIGLNLCSQHLKLSDSETGGTGKRKADNFINHNLKNYNEIQMYPVNSL